jgi:hypothetical protein
LKWIRTGHPLSRRSTQWFMSIVQVAECLRSARGEEARSPLPPHCRGDRRPLARPQSVRLGCCDAGPPASRAVRTIADKLPRPTRFGSASGASSPGSGFPLGQAVRGEMTVLTMRALTSAVDSPRARGKY